MARRASQFDPNIDPELLRSFEAFAETYDPYDIELFSGYRPNPSRRLSQHGPLAQGRKGAIDFRLKDKQTGRELPTARDPSSGQAYQQAVNAWYQTLPPEQQQMARWGGYFSDFPDWMHVDFGGADRMAAGGWRTGFSPERMAALGYTQAGGIEALNAQMQAAGYTPEQRRAAIASIESQGSGDYAARGKELGNDRALGRYQIMQSNLPEWSRQALGREVNAAEFMADPKLQDQIFDAIYGGYVSKYGERGAASKWFTGSENEPQRSDAHGKLTGETYADRYMKALGLNADSPSEGGTPATATATGPKKKGFDWGKFAEGFGDMAAPAGNAPMPYQSQPTPAPSVASSPAAPMVNPEMQQMQRERLAQALAMLQGGGYGQV